MTRYEAFWFRNPETGRAHAFELVEGDLEPLSACGRVALDSSDDEPLRTPEERYGRACMFCLGHVAAESRPRQLPLRRDGRRRPAA